MARAISKDRRRGFNNSATKQARSRKTNLTLAPEVPASVEKQIKWYLTEIRESLKRARKMQAQTNRLKKKTQAILDKLR